MYYDLLVPNKRAGQEEMVRHISSGSTCGNAPTGTGKTIALLCRAYDAASEGKKTLIAVPTHVLQRQVLKEHKALGEPFPLTLIRGVSNYYCPKRVKNLLATAVGGKVRVLEDRILREIPTHVLENKIIKPWSKGHRLFCEDCKERCGYRASLESAPITVVTHALLPFLEGDIDLLLYDEAHNLYKQHFLGKISASLTEEDLKLLDNLCDPPNVEELEEFKDALRSLEGYEDFTFTGEAGLFAEYLKGKARSLVDPVTTESGYICYDKSQSVGERFKEQFPKAETHFVSGTLDPEVFEKELGLGRGWAVGSPMSPNDLLFHVPDDTPLERGDQEGHEAALTAFLKEHLPQFLDKKLGGCLVLFTSRGRMERVFSALSPLLGDKASIEKDNIIIFGCSKFREGFDRPGLKWVIMERFPTPREKLTLEDALSLTKMNLLQALGRLQRRSDDRGVFTLFDGRFKNYLPRPVDWNKSPKNLVDRIEDFCNKKPLREEEIKEPHFMRALKK